MQQSWYFQSSWRERKIIYPITSSLEDLMMASVILLQIRELSSPWTQKWQITYIVILLSFKLGTVAHLCNLSISRSREEDHYFKTSLDDTAKSYLKGKRIIEIDCPKPKVGKSFKSIVRWGNEEMAQGLRLLVAFLGDPCPILCTHMLCSQLPVTLTPEDLTACFALCMYSI